jgi:hypothetical protein
MKIKAVITSLAGAVVLALPMLAGAEDGFAALQGIEAQPLSHDEMQTISGKLNAYDIAAVLQAEASALDAFPRLQAYKLRRAEYFLTNAEIINARYAALGILTPCRTCAP